VPADLFKYAINATDFDDVFYNTALTTIPENLFAKAVKATSFTNTFAYTGISAIPENLFANCPEVTSFNYIFERCENLTTIPVGIFDYNRKVNEFSSVFSNSNKITGESPYTVINGVKVHLYERKNYTDEFVTPASFESAFGGCSKLTDYANIPTEWK
jgi:hypothetical protein